MASRKASPPLDHDTIFTHACEQLAQGCYLNAERPRMEPTNFQSQLQRPDHTHRVHTDLLSDILQSISQTASHGEHF